MINDHTAAVSLPNMKQKQSINFQQPIHPKEPPFPANKENVENLKKWLLEQLANSAFKTDGQFPAMSGKPAHVPFAGPLTARVSAFADDITVFVSRRLDIKAVKKAVGEYERIAGAKVNFDKSEGLCLGTWRGSDTLPGPFSWSDGPICILGVWFGPDLQLERN